MTRDRGAPGPTDAFGDAVLSWTLDGRIVSWSPAAEQLLGYRAAEAIGHGIELLVPPELAEGERVVFAGLAGGAPVTHHETVLRAKDGRTIEVWMSLTPIHDEHGTVQGATAIVRHAGERQRIEEERARLAAIVDWSDDAIISKTLEGIVTSWNGGAERLFGYTAEEAIGRSITMIIPPERSGEEIEVLAKLRRGETIEHFETERLRKDGTRVVISLTVSPVRSSSGTIIGASKIARDITEQKRVERERAAMLAETQRASQAKDEFIAMLGHELRNPLGAITSAIHLLDAAGGDPALAARARDVIRRQSAHLAHMVDDLLDVGRMITGKIILDRKPIDLAETVRAQLETLRGAGRLKDHAVTLCAQPAWVRADTVRVEQVLANLVGNAVRYTPRGAAIRVIVEIEHGDAVLRVEDEGIGFDAELASQIFELFTQGQRRLDRSHGGLGIGLTLVRRIAELHGGSAEAVSAGPDQGSRFSVRFPLLAAPELPKQPQTKGSTPAPSGVRVLLVEDNEDAREMLSTLLSQIGYEVRSAADGEEGLLFAEQWRPELFLLDIGLPKLDGYELCRRIRARLGTTPYVVALTGYGAADDIRRAHDAGFDLHLTKPARPDDLRTLGARARERLFS